MGTTWQYTSLITNVVDALLANDTGIAIAEFIEQVGASELLAHIDKRILVETIGEEYEPKDIFNQEDLEEWATDNDFVSAAEMDNYDPPGYEERARY